MLLTPNTPVGHELIQDTMAIAEIFTHKIKKLDKDALFLIAFIVKVKGAKSTPYRKPKEFKLSKIIAAIKNNDIGIGKMIIPEYIFTEEDELSDKAIAQRDHRYAMVQEALSHGANLYFRHHGDNLIQNLALKYSMKREKVQELINEFYRFGRRKNALLSQRGRARTKPSREYKKLGRRREEYDEGVIGTNVSSDAMDNMASTARKWMLDEFGSSYQHTYEEYLIEHHDVDMLIDPRGIGSTIEVREPNSAISFDQFYRWLPEALGMTRAKVNKKRRNNKNYESNLEAHDGSSAEYCFGSAHVYQMDSTEMDMELVFSLDRSKVIGVVTLYVIRDVYSGSIVGLHIGVGKASFKEARMAIFNAFRNKQVFAKEYGVELSEEDWIEGGKCAVLLVDNEELANNISEGVPASANFEVRFGRTYRGDDKGLIESAFHIFHSMYKRFRIKGFKYKNLLGSNRNKPKKEAALTINETMKILIIYSVYHNKYLENPRIPIEATAREDGVNKICREVWNWGLENRFFIPEEISDKELYLQLLETVKIKPDRGVFKIPETGLHYTIRGHIPDKELLDKVANRRLQRPFKCRYLRQLTNFIFIEVNNQFYTAQLLDIDREYKNMSFAECIGIKEVHKKNSRTISRENQKYRLGAAYDISKVASDASEATALAIAESEQPRVARNDEDAKAIELKLAEIQERDRIKRIAEQDGHDVDPALIEGEYEPVEEDTSESSEDNDSDTYESTMANILGGLNHE